MTSPKTAPAEQGAGAVMESSAPVIEALNLRKVYPARHGHPPVIAIEDVSFGVQPRKFTVFLGPSGCGKSTTLHMIGGFEQPSAGSLLLKGEPIRGPGPDRGIVVQDFVLFPWRSVLANIAFGLEMLKRFSRAEIKARAEHYVEHLGLAGFANAYPATLSGGMKQRVAIARTLATQPEFMLMDEPFASLDAQTRDRLIVDLSAIASEHDTTFLFVTHDVREAIRLADRIVVFSPRPARIVESVDITLPRPRDAYGPGVLEVERYLRSLIGKSAEG